MIVWPGILPMWFHYKNPVSGRVPENYWPGSVPVHAVPRDQHEEPRLPAAALPERTATATAAARSLPCAGGKGRLYRFRIRVIRVSIGCLDSATRFPKG